MVLVSGLASDNHDWVAVEKLVSESNLVCSYDRAGRGESDSIEGVPTAQSATDSLHPLLSTAGGRVPWKSEFRLRGSPHTMPSGGAAGVFCYSHSSAASAVGCGLPRAAHAR